MSLVSDARLDIYVLPVLLNELHFHFHFYSFEHLKIKIKVKNIEFLIPESEYKFVANKMRVFVDGVEKGNGDGD
jgi:hypothetical protein